MREREPYKSMQTIILRLAAIVAVLVLTGPFGTYNDFDLGIRIAFWTIAIYGGGVFIHGAVLVALGLTPKKFIHSVAAIIIGTIVGCIPATYLVMTIYVKFSGVPLPVGIFPSIWSNVVTIGILIEFLVLLSLLRELLNPASPAEPIEALSETKPDAQIENVPLLSTLPDGLRPCQIVSFSMQDHYVEVNTVEGSHLLLMRFSDACELLGDLKGARIHRSHWVSHRHIVDVRKSGRKYIAVLETGETVPVSASYLDAATALLKEKNAIH
ncbi:MAG: LytTR family DNA-binding domain-containing protein [Paracoccaceae bacterium]|nr:LytTR family DNA-binding domain-containing protein [Paracoccaceae bacterium]